MNIEEYFFTSESVSSGHPDKIADKISDSLLDHFLKKNPEARCAIECLVTTNTVVVSGEIGKVDYRKEEVEKVIRSVIKDIGRLFM